MARLMGEMQAAVGVLWGCCGGTYKAPKEAESRKVTRNKSVMPMKEE